MRIAFIIRSTLCDVPGGDTIQVLQTAKHLQESGVGVTIYLTNASIDYSRYDLLHFFNITKTNKPFVVSPILVDYSEYDRKYRKGFSGFLLQYFSADTNEYIKTVSRWLKGKDALRSKNYLWKGQQKSIRQVLEKAAWLLPNS